MLRIFKKSKFLILKTVYAIYILILKTLKNPAGILTHEKKKIKITKADRGKGGGISHQVCPGPGEEARVCSLALSLIT